MKPSVLISTLASVDDCEAITALVSEHITYERAITTMPPDWSSRIAGLIADDRITAFAATAGREAVAFCTTTTDVSTWSGEAYLHLDCLFVTEAYRGVGVGRMLVDAVVEHATAAGVVEIQWQTPEWNRDAMRFYERLGATWQPKARFTLALPTRTGHAPIESLDPPDRRNSRSAAACRQEGGLQGRRAGGS